MKIGKDKFFMSLLPVVDGGILHKNFIEMRLFATSVWRVLEVEVAGWCLRQGMGKFIQMKKKNPFFFQYSYCQIFKSLLHKLKSEVKEMPCSVY